MKDKKRKEFQFKEFSLSDEKCGMKLCTDAVLLGAWADYSDAKTILDIGTGSGVLALIAAQKSNAEITAIDIDEDSVVQASENFRNSKWERRLVAKWISLQEFASSSSEKFDIIICNPPYFQDSMLSPDYKKSIAKHNEALNYSSLFALSDRLLQDNGKMNVIIPTQVFDTVKESSLKEGFCIKRKLIIKPTPHKKENRLCIEFVKKRSNIKTEVLTIRDTNLNYSAKYRDLTKDFYIIF